MYAPMITDIDRVADMATGMAMGMIIGMVVGAGIGTESLAADNQGGFVPP
jgi:hypothetical protein